MKTQSLLIALCTVGHVFADALDNWHWRNPLPQVHNLNAVAHGNGQFVAVGSYGTALSSPDGTNWTVRSTGVDADLQAIAFGAGRFVATGRSVSSTNLTEAFILASTDGVVWERRPSPVAALLFGVVRGQDRFVAFGRTGTVLTSPDGLDWSGRDRVLWDPSRSVVHSFSSVAYGAGRFIARLSNGTQAWSEDGTNWVAVVGQTNSPPEVFAYANGIWVGQAFGSSGVVTSTNGVDWSAPIRLTQLEAGGISGIQGFDGFGVGGGRIVGIGLAGRGVASSPDGVTWVREPDEALSFNQGPFGVGLQFNSVAYGDGQWVAVGPFGAIATSATGSGWSKQIRGVYDHFYSCVYADGIFVVVGAALPDSPSEQGAMLTSRDGVNWSETRWPQGLNSVTHGGGKFVVIGANGFLLTSPNGHDWSQGSSGVTLWRSPVTYGDGQFVAYGHRSGSNFFFVSPDGVNWTASSPAIPRNDLRLLYGGGRLVSVGQGGAILTSTDAVTWDVAQSGTTQTLLDIAYGNGVFVATGRSGPPLVSSDGMKWTSTADFPPVSRALGPLTFARGRFILVSGYRQLLTSFDGIQWSPSTTDVNWNYVNHLTFGQGKLLAVSTYGSILQSELLGASLMPIGFNGVGRFELRVLGDPGEKWRVEASTDLLNWSVLADITLIDGTAMLSDPNSALEPRRFYRALPPPP